MSNTLKPVPTMQNAVAQAQPTVTPFLSRSQRAAMLELCKGEEQEFFQQAFIGLSLLIESMPKTYEQDGKGDDAIVYMHYFLGGSDWYITEKDIEDGVTQAYGFAILNGDMEMAALDYISITELVRHGVELDLHWTPKTLRAVKAEKKAQ